MAMLWRGAEHALEDFVDVLGMIGKVEEAIDVLIPEERLDLRVFLEQLGEASLALPHRHGIALDGLIGLLSRQALLGESQKDALGMNEAAEALQIPLHIVRIDDELRDDAREPVEREIEMNRRIGRDAALDGGVGDIALMPQCHVLKCGDDS